MSEGGYRLVHPVLLSDTSRYCRRPYPNHPRGCPNFGKRASCPPLAKRVERLIDLGRDVWAVYNIFPFGAHVAKMRAKHPRWSRRQLECCLYWQGTARKQLRARISDFMQSGVSGSLVVLLSPEGSGVNVTATMERVGLILEWPPRNVAYQVALVGHRRGEQV